MPENNSDEDSPGKRSKVAKVIGEYDLTGIGAEMERLWTAQDEERMSLRTLADYFNTELLKQATANQGMQHQRGDVENLYRLLTDDGVSEGDQLRTRRRLERKGVDVDALRDNFVTYQSIRTYLKEYRDAEYTGTETDRISTELQNIQQLRGRTTAVTESKLEQLRNAGDVVLGEFQTLVDINVYCEDCGTQVEIDELLDRKSCACQQSN
jgi:hypothetical protein